MSNDEEPRASEKDTEEIYREKWYSTLVQIVIPFFLAGMGTITAGIMLGKVQDWMVYRKVNELFVLVSVLCGLKGNLDMCVASRICTHFNVGELSSRKTVLKIVVGNMALVQLQAIVCAMLLSVMTVSVSSAVNGKGNYKQFPLLAAAALITSSSSCFLLDTFLMAIVLFSNHYNFNPDYMAIPIVASLGDVVTISLLSYAAARLYGLYEAYNWVCISVVVIYLVILLPLWLILVLRNDYVRPILLMSWIPVIGALCISQVAGFVLSFSATDFHGFAIFSPIINGIGGNLVSVQASHMGSVLYMRSNLGTLPEDTRILEWPHRVYFHGTVYSRVALILIAISVPGTLVLALLADYIYFSYLAFKWSFLVAFLAISLVQLLILLWLAHALVHWLWRFKIDPDSAAIPYLTAVGDALGTGLLAAMFYMLRLTKQEYQKSNKFLVKLRF